MACPSSRCRIWRMGKQVRFQTSSGRFSVNRSPTKKIMRTSGNRSTRIGTRIDRGGRDRQITPSCNGVPMVPEGFFAFTGYDYQTYILFLHTSPTINRIRDSAGAITFHRRTCSLGVSSVHGNRRAGLAQGRRSRNHSNVVGRIPAFAAL